jgi:prolipoprotein diacylglyceryl transferase
LFQLAIPSPASSTLELGPVTLRFYALSIIVGVIAAIMIGGRRVRAMGGPKTLVSDVAILAVPMGVIGGRIYHVITSPEKYFGGSGDPISALYIWEGGLGIWGAISLGFFGAWIAFRYLKRRQAFELNFANFADALAPGLLIAQGIGRFGNYFNQELFGRPTDLPWALEIDPRYRPLGYSQFENFHPTFLYESIWVFLVAILLIRLTPRYRNHPGAIFALYVALYCLGRFFIELVRIDEATLIAGLRINTLTSILVGVASMVYFLRRSRE